VQCSNVLQFNIPDVNLNASCLVGSTGCPKVKQAEYRRGMMLDSMPVEVLAEWCAVLGPCAESFEALSEEVPLCLPLLCNEVSPVGVPCCAARAAESNLHTGGITYFSVVTRSS